MRMKTAMLAVVATAGLSTSNIAFASAQENDTSADNPTQTLTKENSTCPAMQIVAVHGSGGGASGADITADTGLLGSIVSPVLDAANDQGADASGGFGATTSAEPTSTPEQPSTDSSQPTTDATEEASTTASQGVAAGIGNNNGQGVAAGLNNSDESDGGSQATTHASGKNTDTTETSAAASDAPQSQTETKANGIEIISGNGEANVGRTYITFDGGRDGAFIPGIHDSEERLPEDAAYNERVNAAVDEAMTQLGEIHHSCPETKVALIGHAEGAQVAGQVAERVGNGGDEFPAENIVGVSLLADPSRADNQPVVASGGEMEGMNTAGAQQPAGQGIATLNEGATSGGNYGELSDRTASFCLEGDANCAVEKDSPLARLTTASEENIDVSNPQKSLDYIANTLAPAVVLGGVESLAEDLSFGEGGFEFKEVSGPDSTLIGRIATEAENPTDQSEREDRLVAAGQKLGGMGLAAGVTIAKEALTPENIAQVAAAGVANPAAGISLAGLKLAEATVNSNVISDRTLSTGTTRVLAEADAAGLDTSEVDEAALSSALTLAIGENDYKTTPINEKGDTATTATTGWLLNAAASALGEEASPELIEAAGTAVDTIAPAVFDSGAAATAMEALA